MKDILFYSLTPKAQSMIYNALTRANSVVMKILLPGTSLVSACQCRGHRFDLWSGKILQAMEQLSPCATTTEPVL